MSLAVAAWSPTYTARFPATKRETVVLLDLAEAMRRARARKAASVLFIDVAGSRRRAARLRDMERRGLIWLDTEVRDGNKLAFIVGEVTPHMLGVLREAGYLDADMKRTAKAKLLMRGVP